MVKKIETFETRDGRVFATAEAAEQHEAALNTDQIEPGQRIRYSTNNSGGSYWLGQKDWDALEKAGWLVEWSAWERGRRDWDWGSDVPAHYAWAPAGMTEDQARVSFTDATGQSSWEEGCNCCGVPHNFYEDGESDVDQWVRYASPNGWNKELEAADKAAAKEVQDGE